ncbi:MAG: O-antigen ligase family protein [Pyrinomonadaceae bacterium MAG19_C2-C3]|nr:O-antigen ligase family protein [Pyrinomonadaceae bacterium MAG19_C2-C3]
MTSNRSRTASHRRRRSVHAEEEGETAFPGNRVSTFDSIIFFATLALIPLVAVPYGTTRIVWQIAFECAVFSLGTLWIIEGFFSRTWFKDEHKVFVPLLGLALFSLLQIILTGSRDAAGLIDLPVTISADVYETKRFFWRLLALIVFGVLLVRYTTNKRRLQMLVFTVLATGITSALFGLFRQTTGFNEAYFFVPPARYGEATYAQFINRNHFAYLMEQAFGLGLGLIVTNIQRERLLIYLSGTIPLWIALIACNSRGGILAMFCQILCALALWLKTLKHGKKSRRKSRQNFDGSENYGRESRAKWWQKPWVVNASRGVLITAFLCVIVFGVAWVGGERLTQRVENVQSDFTGNGTEVAVQIDRSGSSRADIWRSTWQLIKAHPFLGSGFGAYFIAITPYHDAAGSAIVLQAHNDYLEALAGGGVVGILFLLAFVLYFVKRARSNFRASDSFQRGACWGALIGMLGVSVHSLVEFGLHTTVNATVFIALIVIAIVQVTAGNQFSDDASGVKLGVKS